MCPGPQQPLQTLGRRLLESFPFVPVIGHVRISIAIFSYDGGLYFGVTGDYDSSSDIDILTAGVERSGGGAARDGRLTGAVPAPARLSPSGASARTPERDMPLGVSHRRTGGHEPDGASA